MSCFHDEFPPKEKNPIKSVPEGYICYERSLKEKSNSRLLNPKGPVEAVTY